jgi:hypothetical protein
VLHSIGGAASVCDDAGDDEYGEEEEDGGYEGDSHEGACAACRGEEGELLLCEGCPQVYHPACCGLRGVPEGEAERWME